MVDPKREWQNRKALKSILEDMIAVVPLRRDKFIISKITNYSN